ncbi:hypothetical protein ACSQ67_001530 [Phaseolus vulgaris]
MISYSIIEPGLVVSADVTLSSIEIYTTHEWLKATPSLYFQCKGDNKTELLDVKETNVSYTFKGEESWQPLTNFFGKKCKRCGVYEEDKILYDDVFDEWELCPSDFTTPDGRYIHFKEKEFNASFLCPDCLPISGAILTLAILVIYKYWQKKKREQDQARFMKLFEDGDDIEDELGLGTII